MSNIHATSKPNSIARDIFNRRDWREKQASALQLNESLKKSNNFTPRGRPRMAVSRDPELYEPKALVTTRAVNIELVLKNNGEMLKLKVVI